MGTKLTTQPEQRKGHTYISSYKVHIARLLDKHRLGLYDCWQAGKGQCLIGAVNRDIGACWKLHYLSGRKSTINFVTAIVTLNKLYLQGNGLDCMPVLDEPSMTVGTSSIYRSIQKPVSLRNRCDILHKSKDYRLTFKLTK